MGAMSYWAGVRAEVAGLPEQVPDAWAFGATSEQADELLGLVLAGTKTGTASSLWDYEAEGEPLPTAGDLSIRPGRPRGAARCDPHDRRAHGPLLRGRRRACARRRGGRPVPGALAHPVPSS